MGITTECSTEERKWGGIIKSTESSSLRWAALCTQSTCICEVCVHPQYLYAHCCQFFSCQTHFLHNVSLNNPTHHHHLPPPVPRTTCPPLLVNRGRHLDKQMMGILENGTVLWGSFQSFLSGEGGELHTMREDGEWGESGGCWKTQGEPAQKKKREGWDALGKMLLARLLNGSSYSGSHSRASITHLHLWAVSLTPSGLCVVPHCESVRHQSR